MSAEHQHQFDAAPDMGHLACCVDRRCVEWRVGIGREWRELTAAERTELTIFQMEDLVYRPDREIIHGEHWREWFAKVRGHRP